MMNTTLDQHPTVSRGATWWLLLGSLIVVAMISRLSHFLRPLEGDGAVFIYMGRIVSEGGRWGQDIVDNKFPTVGLMASFCWRLFGAYWPAYVLLGAGMSAIMMLALARAARRNFGASSGDATLMFAIVYLNFSWIVWIFGGFQLETPLAMFASLGALAALETLRSGDARDAFALGLCAGTAALLKPTGMSVGAAFVVAMIFSDLSWGRVIRLGSAAALGLLIPLSVAFIYLRATDTLGQIPAIYREISTYAANSSWDWRSDFGKPIVIVVLAGFPFLVRGWIGRRGRVSESADGLRQSSMLVFVLVWMTLETVGVVAQRRMYGYHFLVMAPPLALLYGWLPRRANAASLLAALLPVTVLSLLGTYQMLHDEGIGRPTLAVSDYLKSHAQPGDAVWSDSASRVLLETGMKPGSRCVLTFLFANSDASPLRYSDMILSDFQARSPRFIVLDTDMAHYVQHQSTHVLEYERFPERRANFSAAWARIDGYVHANYEPAAQIGDETVWRRRDAANAQARVSPN
jgi:hypothetical protein